MPRFLVISAAIGIVSFGCAIETVGAQPKKPVTRRQDVAPTSDVNVRLQALSDDMSRRSAETVQRQTIIDGRLANLEMELRRGLEGQQKADPFRVAGFGAAVGAAFGLTSSYIIFIVLTGRRERKHRAIELLNQFMTGEFYTKARLVTQAYLLPNGGSFHKSLDENGGLMNFEDLDKRLGTADATDADKEARFYIRAIPSYFWTVQQAMDAEYISDQETCFDRHYAWYWVFIIQPRIQQASDDRIFDPKGMTFIRAKTDQLSKAEEELVTWRRRFEPEWQQYPVRSGNRP